MSINNTSAVDIPLTMFGGLNTEMSPSDLPEGLSPDCQDVVYVPGSAASRPAVEKLYPQIGDATISYIKTYVQPNGIPLTLILDSNGNFWREDLQIPGELVLISTVTPGSFAKSVTANGREYIAFSDGQHGNESPRQYDGTNFDRVSQDGPGASVGMSVASTIEAAATVSGAGAGANKGITTITPTNPVTVYV